MMLDAAVQNISGVMEGVLIGLLASGLAIFGWLTVISRNPRMFQFQISVFIMIWIAGELVDIMQGNDVLSLMGIGSAASFIHLGAMIFFAAMIWLRFIAARSKGRKLVDDDATSSGYLIDK